MKRQFVLTMIIAGMVLAIDLSPRQAFATNVDLEGVWYQTDDTNRRFDYVVTVAGNVILILLTADRAEPDKRITVKKVNRHWLLQVDGTRLTGYVYYTPRCPNLRSPATGSISADHSRITVTYRSFIGTLNGFRCTMGRNDGTVVTRVLIRR